MGVKDSLKNVAADLGQLSDRYQGEMLPRWDENYNNIGLFRSQEIDPFTERMGMMSMDPSQQGYDAATVNAMRGNATGALAGARRTSMEDANRNIAASGMGNTGMGIRTAANMGRDYAAQQRAANNQVDLQQGQQKKSDMWNAIQAQMQGMGMAQNTYNQQQQSLAGRGNIFTNQAQMLGMKVPALLGANTVGNSGFWGNFTNSLGGALGGSLGSFGAPNVGGSGVNWGRT